MKKHIAIIFFISCAILKSQTFQNMPTYKNTTLDVITDVADIALGESFVANSKSQFAFFENPAALPNNNGTRLFYNYRSFGGFKAIEDRRYFSFGAVSSSSIGNFGFSYNEYSSGKNQNSPDDPNQTTENINRTFILSYSHDIIGDLYAGASVKLFNGSLKSTGMDYEMISNNAFLFDFGLLYQTKGFLIEDDFNDFFRAGVSLQNFGTDYKEEHKYLFNETVKRKLPRYLRIGFAYELNMILGPKMRANIGILLTGEYKNLINPTPSEESNVDYSGAGIEATLFKIISLRLGGTTSPEDDNILFDRAKINLRYGIGMNFPLAIGLGYPMVFRFDYANIPINQTMLEGSKNSLYGFGVSLSYGLTP